MLKGECNCGAVQFSIQGPLPGLYQCHCSLCQKQSGTASNAGTLVECEYFRWESGAEFIKQWQKPSGFSSHFCRECGSPVPNRFKDYMWVPVGLMSGITTPVVAHICVEDTPAWDQPQDTSRSYPGMPDDIDEFLQFLKSSAH
ncbi:GFA family protein [Marinobacterium stanieri]|uniref:Uncharacterized conserved protein n=1 Tax=Marinobacterium stanieri TaxID=49186 RepID=A0A1N6NE69_9GAMM|nr:GFA family protein [Marinobacterium stanieri]SIP90286.1 Uncharacterized conserved protein [Marinobacterium stanieri]